MNKHSFCQGSLKQELIAILESDLFTLSNKEIAGYYEQMIREFDLDTNTKLKDLSLSKDFKSINRVPMERKDLKLRNLGTDFPVYFGNPEACKERIMIIAMDAKRNAPNSDDVVVLNSVFSLHSLPNGRETTKNDYWKFIEPLTKENFVYITDVYKLFYEYTNLEGKPKISNKDQNFTDTKNGSIHKAILDKEIALINPAKIITLGKEAKAALLSIRPDLGKDNRETECIFMPHIARTVTQNVPTVADFFIGLGKLKNNEELIQLGDQIKNQFIQHFKN